jgi:hypothetical protein
MEPPQMQSGSCQLRRELAEKFAIAARLYAEAVVELTREPNTQSRQTYGELRANVEKAHRQSESASRAFGAHVEAHQCGWEATVAHAFRKESTHL